MTHNETPEFWKTLTMDERAEEIFRILIIGIDYTDYHCSDYVDFKSGKWQQSESSHNSYRDFLIRKLGRYNEAVENAMRIAGDDKEYWAFLDHWYNSPPLDMD